MASHNDLGKRGEKAVVDILQNWGYTVLECNWFYAKYEIDIIARNEEWILFVEVKTRTSNKWGNPETAISDRKIKRIVEAADFYIKENNITLQARFDVASIITQNDNLVIDYIDDAFMAPQVY